ncbi:BamA/OMP85 family outer membrane protein [Cardinium endosymbiont of Culicoides punctatus]|uniref:BamA/OMP85 family outer membrane protein n=1 Tax=Cardinium endosymbiont of Culicoides punctatus TaxID=2304601 RepID=UPI0010590C38|nr:POTRA domain-containing protein [Cardinium endosymbiont of Culicoides punctatus]TDG95765.1 Outer membrane protein assembly factor BamA [Cardinium endosymbiont of Culicoides punctatus]
MIDKSIGKVKRLLVLLFLYMVGFSSPVIGATSYIVRNVQVVGNTFIDKDILISLSGLQEGITIHPSSGQISNAIRKIAKHNGVKSVEIHLSDIDDTTGLATFIIHVEEYPVLSNYIIEGLKKKEQKTLLEKITINNEVALSPLFLHETATKIKQNFLEEGFGNVQVSMDLISKKEIEGKATLKIHINKGPKITINKIIFEGNEHIDTSLLIYNMKKIKEAPRFTLVKDVLKNIITLAPIRKRGILLELPKTMDEVMRYFSTHVSFSSSVFTQEKYLEAKENLILFYQSKGFRDVRIVEEQLSHISPNKLNIHIKIQEGKQYTVRSVKWVGNYLHSDQELDQLLHLQNGKVYDPVYINSRLNPGVTDKTINDLYTDNGYLFFRAEAVEVGIEDNQVDLEIRIHEGRQATINQIHIVGNTITHDYVIRRELLTLPGEKFSRRYIMGSLRNLVMLDLFKPEKLIPEIEPDEVRETVDITYSVVEKPKFDVNLKANYSEGIVFELVLGSNNISLGNLFTGKLPLGAAQHFHLTISFNGKNYRNLSFSFQEPWLWLGDSRYLFSLSVNDSHRTKNKEDYIPSQLDLLTNTKLFPYAELGYGKSFISSKGGKISLGKKLHGYWESHMGIDYHYHAYQHYELLEDNKKRSGRLHDFSLDFSLVHNNVNDVNFPTRGWSLANFLTLTPPYSLLGYNQTKKATIPCFKEFAKLMVDFSSFYRLPGDFILNLRGHAGFLTSLSKKEIGIFERFRLGGTSSISDTSALLGGNFIPLRGYPDDSLTPRHYKKNTNGGVLFNKFVSELRYPIIRTPTCIYLLGFIEMGDSWLAYSNYNPLSMKKSVGGGVRVILPIPMIPMLGLDIAYRLDAVKGISSRVNPIEFHFTFGPSIR